MLGYLIVPLSGLIIRVISLFNILLAITFRILISNQIKLEFVLHKIFVMKISVEQKIIKMLQETQYSVLIFNVTEGKLIKKFTKSLIILEFLHQLSSYNSRMVGNQIKQLYGLISPLTNLLNKLKINLFQQQSLI